MKEILYFFLVMVQIFIFTLLNRRSLKKELALEIEELREEMIKHAKISDEIYKIVMYQIKEKK